MQPSDAMLAPFQAALDSLVAARLRSRDQARALDGKAVALRVEELDLVIYMCAEGERLVLRGTLAREPDAGVAGRIPTLLRAVAAAARGGDALATLPEGLKVSGDATVIRDLRALLAGLELDWEERLAKITGDPVAHAFGELLRKGGRAVGYAGDRLIRDVAEYLREETKQVVSKQEVARFNDGVDAMRDDVERFAARMARLEAEKR